MLFTNATFSSEPAEAMTLRPSALASWTTVLRNHEPLGLDEVLANNSRSNGTCGNGEDQLLRDTLFRVDRTSCSAHEDDVTLLCEDALVRHVPGS